MQMECKSHAYLLAALGKSDRMGPWGKFGWRSLNSRESVVRTRGAVAWEQSVDGGQRRKVVVGRMGVSSMGAGISGGGWGWRWVVGAGEEATQDGDRILREEGGLREGTSCHRGQGWLAEPRTLHQPAAVGLLLGHSPPLRHS